MESKAAKATHSVTLDKDKCVGCTNCIKHCPTEAIRVRNGKARIIDQRCIDCGECIRVCPQYAKKAVCDKLEDVVGQYKWLIALPAPTLMGQFTHLEDLDYVLDGLLRIGFDDVFEVSYAAEILSDYTRLLLEDPKLKRPVISSACPAVVKLITIRFPSLCDRVLPLLAPVELAAKMARAEACKAHNLTPKEVGCVFISPCPAKVTAAREPFFTDDSGISAVVSITDVYKRLVGEMRRDRTPKDLTNTGRIGLSWATSGGESAALLTDQYLAADGIEHVINVLEEVEDGKLDELDFIELNACTSGCVGGVLTVANPFVARARIFTLRKFMPVACGSVASQRGSGIPFTATKTLAPRAILQLSPDPHQALSYMHTANTILEHLPKLDCGSCGAPTCRALAEDIAGGFARENDCVFILKEKIAGLYNDAFGKNRYTTGGPGETNDSE